MEVIMTYSVTYQDETGASRVASISENDYLEALENDYLDLQRRYNARYVTIQKIHAEPGEALHLVVTVNAPSHYLTSLNDKAPKECRGMSVHIICYPGYPLKSVYAYYAPDHFLASPNVFRSGVACIDNWIPFTSSLTTVVDKLVHDMIHDPVVTRYDSMANGDMEQWHKSGVASRQFPTLPPKLLYVPDLPPRRPRHAAASRPIPPPLPPRKC